MSNDTVTDVMKILIKLDREQGVLLERVANFTANHDKLEKRVVDLEDKTEPLTWLSQTKTATLWLFSLLGGVGYLLTVITKLK